VFHFSGPTIVGETFVQHEKIQAWREEQAKRLGIQNPGEDALMYLHATPSTCSYLNTIDDEASYIAKVCCDSNVEFYGFFRVTDYVRAKADQSLITRQDLSHIKPEQAKQNNRQIAEKIIALFTGKKTLDVPCAEQPDETGLVNYFSSY